MILYVSSPTLGLCLRSTSFEFRSILRDRWAVSYKHGRKSSQGLLLSDWAEKHKRFLAPVEARTAATVWNRSGKTMFPGAHAWKLLSRLFFRPNWLPLGLRGWFHCGIRLHLLCTAAPSPQTKSGRGTSVSYRLSPRFPFSGRGSCTQATTMIGSYIVFIKVWQIVDHRERPVSVLKTDAKCGWMDKKTLARFFFPLSFDNDQ